MPNIYAAATDGYALANATGGSWADARDSTGSDLARGNGGHAGVGSSAYAVYAIHSSARGGMYQVWRSFFAFDTSGISSAPASATLKIYGYNTGTGDVIAVKATKPDLSTGIVAADFDAITGFSTGASMNGNVTDYSAEISSWSTSGYNDITLNAAALSDMASLSVFAVAIVNYTYDYLNVAPSSAEERNGLYFVNQSGTSKDPYIEYAAAGYGNTVLGVASANIGKIVGVATADIDKFIGVDD